MNIKYLQTIIILSLFISVLLSCSNNENKNNDTEIIKTKTEIDPRIIHNNFEYRWTNSAPIELENDNSLNYVCRLNNKRVFSSTFKTKLINTIPKDSSNNISIFIKYNIFLTNSNSSCKLVCSIDSAGNSLYWKCQSIEETVYNFDEWVSNENMFEINTAKIDRSNNMKIYFWNPDKTDLMIDDITIEFQ